MNNRQPYNNQDDIGVDFDALQARYGKNYEKVVDEALRQIHAIERSKDADCYTEAALMQRRNSGREVSLEEAYLQSQYIIEQVDSVQLCRTREWIYLKAKAKLTGKEVSAFENAMNGMSWVEIGNHLDCSDNTARRAAFRAAEKLGSLKIIGLYTMLAEVFRKPLAVIMDICSTLKRRRP